MKSSYCVCLCQTLQSGTVPGCLVIWTHLSFSRLHSSLVGLGFPLFHVCAAIYINYWYSCSIWKLCSGRWMLLGLSLVGALRILPAHDNFLTARSFFHPILFCTTSAQDSSSIKALNSEGRGFFFQYMSKANIQLKQQRSELGVSNRTTHRH